MSEIEIRVEGRAGRITLTRPQALNALTYDMVLAVEAALDAWRDDEGVALVLLDAAGDKAFCAGGDIAALYASGTAGDFAFGRRFWADEYRVNAKLAEYPKPVVSLMQGFTMGGGVGLGCHASHRVVGETSRISMPECGIGLVPDVGGSLLLARAPGRLGSYLGLTAARLENGDVIAAGFADHFIPQAAWPELVATLCRTGDPEAVAQASEEAPQGPLSASAVLIDRLFHSDSLADILAVLRADDSDFAASVLKAVTRNSPLAMACTLEMLARLRGTDATIRTALDLEYRVTWRAMEHGDFLEGIRAAIIDKDRKPVWKHGIDTLPPQAVADMLAPLGDNALTF
ncbi:MAG: enoyl-CoA hydratase/isomerase family protein [Paracoccaceae bacterium]|uniref:enoyl-CoA hydratase/isomerase family protein n=1 Tax=Seohaeicola saemankumensis TaxID=481181 RepID=UPI001E5D6C82|nr:enoyl-CoA hydratase/isomerase family protein [Seohaeicola saemankumensis]MCD1624517.1 enoyl-CoA hydratase/isomerase family protein [Seohaeicola saemankumensis]